MLATLMTHRSTMDTGVPVRSRPTTSTSTFPELNRMTSFNADRRGNRVSVSFAVDDRVAIMSFDELDNFVSAVRSQSSVPSQLRAR